MTPIEFDIRTPCTLEVLESQIASSRTRGLPEVEPIASHAKRLTLVGNGPSAIRAPMGRSDTMAANGALTLFTKRDLAPDFWIACDPQERVVEFLKDAPHGTTYLVASKCHPAVFDALRGHHVVVWHIDDAPSVIGAPATVPCATSVTLCALSVARLLGYRNIETWGWDGCFWGSRGHAVQQFNPNARITNLVGHEKFETTPTWCAEAHDATLQIPDADYRVKVQGGGMIGAILKLQARALPLARGNHPAWSNRTRPQAA